MNPMYMTQKEPRSAILIHGGTTYENRAQYLRALQEKNPKLEWFKLRKDWKYELQDRLGDQFVVYAPQMPNKTNAQYDEWKLWFEKVVDLLGDEVTLIGHSLGALFLVKYLSENTLGRKARKLCLLGTPYDNAGMGAEQLGSFIRIGDLSSVALQVSEIYFYHSEDDFAVPFGKWGQSRLFLVIRGLILLRSASATQGSF